MCMAFNAELLVIFFYFIFYRGCLKIVCFPLLSLNSEGVGWGPLLSLNFGVGGYPPPPQIQFICYIPRKTNNVSVPAYALESTKYAVHFSGFKAVLVWFVGPVFCGCKFVAHTWTLLFASNETAPIATPELVVCLVSSLCFHRSLQVLNKGGKKTWQRIYYWVVH